MTIRDEPSIPLYLDEADDLLGLLRGLVEWLGHCGYGTYEEITDFYNSAGNGRLAVAGLISVLDQHAVTLNRRLKETTP